MWTCSACRARSVSAERVAPRRSGAARACSVSPLPPETTPERALMRLLKSAAVLAVAVLAAACGGTSDAGTKPTTLRLGYFPNLTHASAVYGVASGTYARELGSTT